MSEELTITKQDEFGNVNVLCPTLRFRIDGINHPRMLGVVCPDGVFWIHHLGVKKFFKELFAWAKYVETHPDYEGLPSSMSFRSCIDATEGAASYQRIYEFAAEGVRSALPLIVNTWNVYQLDDPASAAKVERIIRELAIQSMASCGAIKLGTNHIWLGLMHFTMAVRNLFENYPEGIDFTTTLQQATELEEMLGELKLAPSAIVQQLTNRVTKGEPYTLEPNLLIMFEPDAQDLYTQLKQFTRDRREATALEFLIALLKEPSHDIVESLSCLQVTPAQLAERAKHSLKQRRPGPIDVSSAKRTNAPPKDDRQSNVNERQAELTAAKAQTAVPARGDTRNRNKWWHFWG